jgi:hypothetical protein
MGSNVFVIFKLILDVKFAASIAVFATLRSAIQVRSAGTSNRVCMHGTIENRKKDLPKISYWILLQKTVELPKLQFRWGKCSDDFIQRLKWVSARMYRKKTY